MDPFITEHAYQMGKERLSLSRKALERLAEKAFKEGLKHTDTKGELRKYVTNEYFKYGSANNIRIYGENIFLFSGNRLITLYQLPNELKKHVKYCKNNTHECL